MMQQLRESTKVIMVIVAVAFVGLMVFEWGMSPLGFMALSRAEGEESIASPQTFHEAERHVKSLLDDNYAATTAALTQHRAALDAIAHDLITHETISGEEVRRIVAEHRRAA